MLSPEGGLPPLIECHSNSGGATPPSRLRSNQHRAIISTRYAPAHHERHSGFSRVLPTLSFPGLPTPRPYVFVRSARRGRVSRLEGANLSNQLVGPNAGAEIVKAAHNHQLIRFR